MARIPVIKTVNLCKYFELGKNVVKAVDHVNLEIYSGELVVFLGPSGCGKSTLLNMIAGLDEPTAGEIYIRGEKLSGKTGKELALYRRTKIGMVFQQFNLIRNLNIIDNVVLPLIFSGVPKRRRVKRGEMLVEAVGLGDYKNHSPSELSGGQQQKVAIARALASNPWILVADEPTGNLDSKSAFEVITLLVNLSRRSRRTIIMVTHNPDYKKYADRVIYMKDGKIFKIKVNRVVKSIGKEGEDWIPSLRSAIYTKEVERKKEKEKKKKEQRKEEKNLSYDRQKLVKV